MKVNSTYVLSGALILAGIVALMVRSHLSSPPPVPQQVAVKAPEQIAVLVAAKDLHPGDFLDSSSLRWQVTAEPVSRTFNFIRGKDSQTLLLGATLRESITAGTPLTSNVVVKPNEPGFVAAVLRKGMRAISIPTNAVASNSGLVAAGDRVDIILSLRRDEQPEPQTGGGQTAAPLLASQTIVRDLRVLALNNQTDTDVRPRQDVVQEDDAETTASNRSRTAAVGNRPRSVSYQTVTVEVTSEQAEILAVAKEVGMLHLALRSSTPDELDNARQGASPVTTLSQSTSIYNGLSGSGHQVKVFRGAQKDVLTFPAR
ncbi:MULTISPECIES: Flp pilus assembly protein CpaB [unclassified Brenneria]|uniref:Flp pilus assembly protein CpaB n=1 Tax=unclassified Brenneria TaxID=2634434 RepID=UPI0015552B5D|nr:MULTISPECIES: Flp pilus assembly protein CpaB [unclassified Brenneria]MBJ7222678.1 Flp pilus assembly protein CpaB [Brenneria sp. L3-3C-1]MEE3643921.1 Flp pilus assembly protein CpaB [Brenneria sp. L3_3C_1]MEE3651126.1 Flp pilus assembly protein CpaB [Brenneria sp. HEZEL_4_2_4]NPD01081.1 Flp pilus assembly protein CpaB [Brenneria sp. hezel4-2-4]